jgi:trehalose 6-phosphate synthase
MSKDRPVSSKSFRFGLLIALISATVTGSVCWFQVRGEHRQGLEDLTRRAQLLGHRVMPVARLALAAGASRAERVIDDRFDGHSRLLGMVLYSTDGKLVAAGQGLADVAASLDDIVAESLQTTKDVADLRRDGAGSTHVLVQPVRDDKSNVKGAVVVLHDALYLEDRMTRGILLGVIWSSAVGVGMFLISTGLAWAIFERPLHLLAEWMRRLRFGNTPEQPPRNLPVGRLADETVHLAASFRAARSKERDDAQEFVRSDRAWTRDRLRAHAIDALEGQPLVVVSNREPYMHQLRDGKPALVRPASGLVTGLDPVLRATGGLWVAHGAGDADRQTSDAAGCVPVPPEDPRYTLKRVWITKEEEQGYYYGFSNEGLWPLCHLTHERPTFRSGDWDQYVRANQRFANAVLEEIGGEKAVVMVQDYQLALVPGMLKAVRPDLRVGLFWHIPWPNAEAFRICPYRVELLQGMLGADLLGFHLQQHCNNFLETVDRMVEAKLDWDRFSAEIKGHTAIVRPFPISVQRWSERGVASGEPLAAQVATLRHQHQLEGCVVGVGVDRIDYTKGIAEKFRAIERLFERYPKHRGKFTFVQLGAPSRVHIPRYRDLVTELEAIADAINWKFQADGWKPIRFLVDHHEGPAVYAFLKLSAVCIVSSLHDGMNLVAKEYVAAKAEADGSEVEGGQEGVLVLSEFAGAARDLPEALVINPYDTEEFAEAIHRAIEMEPKERRSRMTRMRVRVEEFNIYRWAAKFLTSLAQAREAADKPEHRGPAE